MSPRIDSPTHLIGAVTRRAAGTTGRVLLAGLGAGLNVLESSRRVRNAGQRYAETALQLASSTPLGRLLPTDVFDDDADREGQRIASQAKQAAPPRPPAAPTPPQAAPAPPKAPAQPAGSPATGAPAPTGTGTGTGTAERHEVPEAAKEVGAPGASTAAAEAAVSRISDIPAEPARDELPIADFDNATLASLRARLRSLSLEQLAVLREYEQAHAHRLPVITMLDNRIAKLAAESTAANAAG